MCYKGYKMSEETKKKMSLARLGKKGHKFTEESKKKMSLARLGIVFSEEHKKKISIAHLGKKHSEETRKKLSIASIGREYDDEWGEKFRGTNNYRWISDLKVVGLKHYVTAHYRIYRKYGKADCCEICGDTQAKYEWSNKDHKYSMNRDDWQKLCIPCHKRYDRKLKLSRARGK